MGRCVRPAAMLAVLAGLAGCAMPPPPGLPGGTNNSLASLERLPGWRDDPVAQAMPAVLRGCARFALTPPDQKLGGDAATGARAGDWLSVCADARALPPNDDAAARRFLARDFTLVPLGDATRPDGLFTGYYEPELAGSREKTRRYDVPVLAKPADLLEQAGSDGVRQFGRLEGGRLVPYYSRAEIDGGALRRQRLDLLYLASPVDLFMLQIQGAGRVDLPNGHVVRLGYAATNGQPYVPIGRVLSQRGDLPPDQVSAASIRAWLAAHPREARATMALNPSYIFMREIPELSPDEGPLGTLGVPLTPLRSVAVDARRVPLGALLWIDTTDADGHALQRLMVAQDTGSGVAGGVRADIFYGWGGAAEDMAGRLQARGRAWMLLPRPQPAPPS